MDIDMSDDDLCNLFGIASNAEKAKLLAVGAKRGIDKLVLLALHEFEGQLQSLYCHRFAIDCAERVAMYQGFVYPTMRNDAFIDTLQNCGTEAVIKYCNMVQAIKWRRMQKLDPTLITLALLKNPNVHKVVTAVLERRYNIFDDRKMIVHAIRVNDLELLKVIDRYAEIHAFIDVQDLVATDRFEILEWVLRAIIEKRAPPLSVNTVMMCLMMTAVRMANMTVLALLIECYTHSCACEYREVNWVAADDNSVDEDRCLMKHPLLLAIMCKNEMAIQVFMSNLDTIPVKGWEDAIVTISLKHNNMRLLKRAASIWPCKMLSAIGRIGVGNSVWVVKSVCTVMSSMIEAASDDSCGMVHDKLVEVLCDAWREQQHPGRRLARHARRIWRSLKMVLMDDPCPMYRVCSFFPKLIEACKPQLAWAMYELMELDENISQIPCDVALGHAIRKGDERSVIKLLPLMHVYQHVAMDAIRASAEVGRADLLEQLGASRDDVGLLALAVAGLHGAAVEYFRDAFVAQAKVSSVFELRDMFDAIGAVFNA